MKITSISLFIALLFSVQIGSAQSIVGEVSCEGKPVAFAAMVNAATNKGTIANELGKFRLTKSGEYYVSAIGFKTKIVELDTLSFHKIALERAQYDLTEHTVLGDKTTAKDILKAARKKTKQLYGYSYQADATLSIRDKENDVAVRAADARLKLCGTGQPKPHIQTDNAYVSDDYSATGRAGLTFTTEMLFGLCQIKHMVGDGPLRGAKIDGTDIIDARPVVIITLPSGKNSYLRFHIATDDYAILRAENMVNEQKDIADSDWKAQGRLQIFKFHDVRTANYEKIGDKYYLKSGNINVYWLFDEDKVPPIDVYFARAMNFEITNLNPLACETSKDDRYLQSTRFFIFDAAQIGYMKSWEQEAHTSDDPEAKAVLRDFKNITEKKLKRVRNTKH